MSLLTRGELTALMAPTEEPCISIYLPTHRAGAETQQDRIRLKNLLKKAEDRLVADGERKPAAEAMLKPAWRLVEDRVFWQHQSDGLALFLSSRLFRHYRLPLAFDELVVTTDRFHLKPLLPLLTGDGLFYILALSQKQVRLFEASHHSVGEVDLGAEVPKSLADALGYDWEQRSLQFHTGSAGGGQRAALFHGQGAGVDDRKPEIKQFLNLLDNGLVEALSDRLAPLVLAAVDYLIPMYREVSRYPHLLERGVVGNPDEQSADQLHRKAWKLVEPQFLSAQREAVERFGALAGTGRAANDLREVLNGAHDGRVDTLFVALGVQRWGRFEPQTRALELHDEPDNSNEDLLDMAALQSLIQGGTVYAVDPEAVPGDGELAAVFRY
jgi:hypothetical protein